MCFVCAMFAGKFTMQLFKRIQYIQYIVIQSKIDNEFKRNWFKKEREKMASM